MSLLVSPVESFIVIVTLLGALKAIVLALLLYVAFLIGQKSVREITRGRRRNGGDL